MVGEESALATKAGSYLSLTAAGNYATFSRSGMPRIHFKAKTTVYPCTNIFLLLEPDSRLHMCLHIGHSVSTSAWFHLGPG